MKDWICQQVKENATFVPASKDSFNHKHVITGYRLVPQPNHVELIWQGHYLTTSYEEADVIIPQQIVSAAETGILQYFRTIWIFIILHVLHYYYLKKLSCTLLIEGTYVHRTFIGIAATVKINVYFSSHTMMIYKYRNIMINLRSSLY